ncbi:protein indeterminate-domain 2-like [Olea europaea var. sylvestris]|uniref:protein indeterminate-domain 2-like n=1 Tax=Olea europaea var. sylvestris TaxID=158386 RepID=UPI000C1CE273|nr:protein indeterminate-domain 2-like [Olea europaea var. sylvestris]
MSNMTGDEGSFSSGNTGEIQHPQEKPQNSIVSNATTNSNDSSSQQPPTRKKRNLPGNPDPTAEVIALSPTTLMATNRFLCEICNKGFQRDQNLQLHRRGHNLPWKLRQRTNTEIKKRVYVCPEPSCVHHNPARALGDLTGIKKHYSRKHGEKKWKCDKCSKKYAVQSDWKAHQKTCGTREYKCDCGTIFSRRDSFITHRAFCDALAEENNKANQNLLSTMGPNLQGQMPELISTMPINSNANTPIGLSDFNNPLKSFPPDLVPIPFKPMNIGGGMFLSNSSSLFGSPRSIQSSSSGLQLSSSSSPSGYNYQQDGKSGPGQISGSAHMSATALLQKAAQMGATASNSINSPMMQKSFVSSMAGPDQVSGTRPSSNVHQSNSYDNFQMQNEQSAFAGINGGGYSSQLMHKSPQEVSDLFDSSKTGGSAVSDMMMYGGMLMNNELNSGFLKNAMEQEDSENSGPVRGRNVVGMNSSGPSRLGGNDVMTVDFLGVGGSRPQNMHQQRLDLEAINQQRMQVVNPFQQFSHRDSAMEKPLWDDV